MNYIFIAVFIAIVFFVVFFSQKAIVKRKLKKANSKRISRFRTGDTAKVIGKLTFIEQPLIAPLSKRKCAYYQLHVEQMKTSGKNTSWKTLIKEEQYTTFLIEDAGFYAIIRMNNLQSYVVRDRKYSSGFLRDATQNLESVLNSRGYSSEGLLGLNKKLRYSEAVLEEGETIAVFGKGVWKSAKELGLPNSYNRVLEIMADNKNSVCLSDDPSTTKKNELPLGRIS